MSWNTTSVTSDAIQFLNHCRVESNSRKATKMGPRPSVVATSSFASSSRNTANPVRLRVMTNTTAPSPHNARSHPERDQTEKAVSIPRSYSSSSAVLAFRPSERDRKSTRLNSSHLVISYAVFCLKKKKQQPYRRRPLPRVIDLHTPSHNMI